VSGCGEVVIGDSTLQVQSGAVGAMVGAEREPKVPAADCRRAIDHT